MIYFQKNHWICDIKSQIFFVLRMCKRSAHVVTVYPVCPWMWTKDYWVGSVTCCGCLGRRLITWGPLRTGQRSALPKGNAWLCIRVVWTAACRTKTKILTWGNSSTRKSPLTEWAIAQAKQALQWTTQLWVGSCGGHCSRISGNQQSVGRRPLSFVECSLISHFLITVAFLFVIIQWTACFNKQIRSCTRRLAYLPAAIPDFAFLINTELGALRGKRPKSFFQLFQTLDSPLELGLSLLSEQQVWDLGNLLDYTTSSEKKPVLLQEEEEEEAMGSSRNLTLDVDLLSQPCRAVAMFCRYVIPPLTFLNFSSLPILVSSILVGCNKRGCYKLYVLLKQWFCSNAR